MPLFSCKNSSRLCCSLHVLVSIFWSTVPATSTTFLLSSSMSLTGSWKTRSFTNPPKKKSSGVMSGLLAGQGIGPPLPIHWAGAYFTLLFPSACACGRRGEIQPSICGKAGGLDDGYFVSAEGVCYGVTPASPWLSSGSPARVSAGVCPKSWLFWRHPHEMTKPLYFLLLYML